jgi:acetyl-CoA acyltransferase
VDDSRTPVIVDAVRTPIGRGHREKGYYKDTHPATLLASCLQAVIERTGVDPAQVGDVLSGCVMQYGEQTYNIARTAWLQAGFPYTVPGTTIDRQCGSAQQAVNFAAAMIGAGVHDVVVAAGVEHMGHNPLVDPFDGPHGVAWTPELRAKSDIQVQSVGAELIADEWDVTRAEMDELILQFTAYSGTARGGVLKKAVEDDLLGNVLAAR